MRIFDNTLKRKFGVLVVLGILGIIVLGTSVTADLDNEIWFRDDANNDVSLSTTYASGYDVGIGMESPSTKLEVRDTSTQLRLSYSGTYYTDLAVASDGDLSIQPSESGQIKFQPTTDSTGFFQVLEANTATPVLVVDTTNERVGVGVSNPASKLEINGNILFDKDADRSISVESPPASHAGYKLTITAGSAYSSSSTSGYVGGDLLLTGGAGAGSLSSTGDGGNVCIYGGVPAGENDRGNVLILHDGSNPTGGRLGVSTSNPTAVVHIANCHSTLDCFRVDGVAPYFTPFVIDKDGNVGVGTSSPDTELHVNGEIKQKITTSDVSNPPTDAELDTLWTSPATQGDGWTAYLKDSDSDYLYQIVAVGTEWYIFSASKAT
jgi:hypothetical protein